MELVKKNDLVKYNKNLTPEQKEERRIKALQTRRENKIIASSLKQQMKKKYAIKSLDSEGNEIVQIIKGSDAIATRMMQDLLSPFTKPKDVVEIATFIRDTLGEKPKDEVEKKVEANVNVSWEAFVKKLQEGE